MPPKANTTLQPKRKVVTNYVSDSSASNLELVETLTIKAAVKAKLRFSAVLKNSNGTPYLWMSDDSGEFAPAGKGMMIYMTKKGSKLYTELNGISGSQHSLRRFADTEKEDEFYVIASTTEEGGAEDLEILD